MFCWVVASMSHKYWPHCNFAAGLGLQSWSIWHVRHLSLSLTLSFRLLPSLQHWELFLSIFIPPPFCLSHSQSVCLSILRHHLLIFLSVSVGWGYYCITLSLFLFTTCYYSYNNYSLLNYSFSLSLSFPLAFGCTADDGHLNGWYFF